MTVQDDERERELVRVFNRKISIDFALSSRAASKLELDDLFDVYGRKTSYSIDDAKRLHKQQWTADQYANALDARENGVQVISQGRMLQILRLRCEDIGQRGATLNNPHIPKAHLDNFADTYREIKSPDWASAIRKIAADFVVKHPKHPAIL